MIENLGSDSIDDDLKGRDEKRVLEVESRLDFLAFDKNTHGFVVTFGKSRVALHSVLDGVLLDSMERRSQWTRVELRY